MAMPTERTEAILAGLVEAMAFFGNRRVKGTHRGVELGHTWVRS
jgi:hypothetical protein